VPPQLKQVATKKQQKIKKSVMPVLVQKRVDALVQKHDAKKLQAMANEGQAKLKGDRRVLRKKKAFDLWESDEKDVASNANTTLVTTDINNTKKVATVSSKQAIKNRNREAHKSMKVHGIRGEYTTLVAEPVSRKLQDAVAVDLAHAGQSYRPDPQQYSQAVQQAVDVEIRRNLASAEAKAPLANGMSEATRALLVGDSSDEEESDNDDEQQQQQQDASAEKTTTTTDTIIRKRPEKMTRAERNKQKRLRQEKVMQQKAKQQKKLENSVAEIPKIKKDFKKQQREMQTKKEQLEEIKAQNKTTPGKNVLIRVSQKDPIHAPTIPVSLEAEHKDASLRTLKPKGSLVTDRMASFVDRNLVSKRKMGDKKRVMQGKRRKLNVKGKGYEIAREMDHKMMG